MVAIPTNYRMGTGLAATIMGQQAGLEAEQQGLANLMKGMQMPAEALKGQEAAMLMQDPQYLQQKTANTLIELKNQYSAQDFQQTLDAANRVRIRLDAAAGDPAKEQQIVQEALSALKIDPSSEFAQYAMKDPRGALTKFIQGVEVGLTGTGGAKQLGAERVAEIRGENAIDLANLRGDIQEKLLGKRLASTGGGSTSAVDKARYKILTAGPQSVVNYTGAALTTGIDPLTKKPIDETDRMVLQAYYEEAQATLNSKGGSEIQLPGGGKISSSKGGRVPPGKRSGGASAADEAASKGF